MIILNVLAAISLITGTLICIVGGIGLIRMKSFYGRVHAASVPDTLGAGLCILGMILYTIAWDDPAYTWDLKGLIIFKLVFIGVFIFISSPIAGHAVTRAAWIRGLGKKESKSALAEKDNNSTGEGA